MGLCSAAMVSAFLATLHAGQVYVGNNQSFHMGVSHDLYPPLKSWDGTPGTRCYKRGTFKGECIGPGTYRMSVMEVRKKDKSFFYYSTVKTESGKWKLSKAGRWASAEALCESVERKELSLDPRKEGR